MNEVAEEKRVFMALFAGKAECIYLSLGRDEDRFLIAACEMKNQGIFIFIARDYICCAAVAQWESVRLKTEMSSVQIRPAASFLQDEPVAGGFIFFSFVPLFMLSRFWQFAAQIFYALHCH